MALKHPEIIKNRILYDPAVPFLSMYPKELKGGSQRDIFIPMFIATLFTIAKSKCPPTDEWTNEMWYVHTIECHPAIKRKEILRYATT